MYRQMTVSYYTYSTQWDSLGHAGALFDADGDGIEEVVYYNGWKVESIKGPSDIASTEQNGSVKAERLGIENMSNMRSRPRHSN